MPARMILTVGTFDGVHKGHAYLLKTLLAYANRRSLTPAVALFEYSPRLFLRKEKTVRLLTTLAQRQEIIKKDFGINHFYELPMQGWFFTVTAEDFLAHAVSAWGVKEFVCGDNFSFGRDRLCTSANFCHFGAPLNIRAHVVKLVCQQSPVSSTHIRGLLAEGDLEGARKLMGRNYVIGGPVVGGRRLAGRILGFPTANLAVDKRKILPLGVFKGWAPSLGRPAVINIGYRPTLTQKSPRKILPAVEVHILGFQGDLYGRFLEVELLEKLRAEKRFANMLQLQRQIVLDIEQAQAKGYKL